jgi:ubiquitin C
MQVQLIVKNPSGGKTLTLKVAPSETVRNVNAKIKQHVQLILDDQLMEDSRSLAYYNTENQSTLHLDLHFQGGTPMPISHLEARQGESALWSRAQIALRTSRQRFKIELAFPLTVSSSPIMGSS